MTDLLDSVLIGQGGGGCGLFLQPITDASARFLKQFWTVLLERVDRVHVVVGIVELLMHEGNL